MSNATIEKPLQAYDIVDVSTLSKNNIQTYFTIEPISDEIFSRIYKKSYKEDRSHQTDRQLRARTQMQDG